MSAKPKASQRERLIEAMIETCADVGYQAASIAEVSASAGVSSATFYEQFGSKEECFLAAYQAAAERMFGRVSLVVAQSSDRDDFGRRALMELTEALCRDPTGGRVVLIEALAAGDRVRQERKRMLRAFARLTSGFVDSSSAKDKTIDVPPIAVMGALRHIVSRHLRMRTEDRLPDLVEPGLAWLQSYAVPASRGYWSMGPGAMLNRPVQPPVSAGLPPLEKLPRGRHGLSAGVVARSRRTRLIYATAEAMMRNGYANTTVADIVSEAKVARDVFYEQFADKEEAFLEAQHFPSQYILDSCVAAYFSASDWPERAWRCLETLLGLIYENPSISYLRLVEAYAAGPTAIRRAEEITRSFTIFLEEGYHYRPQARELPRLCGPAIAGGIFEIIQRLVARGEADRLMQHLPQLTYIAIAPFTGAEEAIGLVEQMAARSQEQREDRGAEVEVRGAAR